MSGTGYASRMCSLSTLSTKLGKLNPKARTPLMLGAPSTGNDLPIRDFDLPWSRQKAVNCTTQYICYITRPMNIL
jgi:hypothetical protein